MYIKQMGTNKHTFLYQIALTSSMNIINLKTRTVMSNNSGATREANDDFSKETVTNQNPS